MWQCSGPSVKWVNHTSPNLDIKRVKFWNIIVCLTETYFKADKKICLRMNHTLYDKHKTNKKWSIPHSLQISPTWCKSPGWPWAHEVETLSGMSQLPCASFHSLTAFSRLDLASTSVLGMSQWLPSTLSQPSRVYVPSPWACHHLPPERIKSEIWEK